MPRTNSPPVGYPSLYQAVYTAKEVAQLARCSVKRVYLNDAQGKLKPTHDTGPKRYSRREVLRYLGITERDLEAPEVA